MSVGNKLCGVAGMTLMQEVRMRRQGYDRPKGVVKVTKLPVMRRGEMANQE